MDKLYQIRNGKAEPVNFSWVPGTGPEGSGISDAVGAIRLYNRNYIPDNARVHGNDKAYSKLEYPELYAIFGDTYQEIVERESFHNPDVSEGVVPAPWVISSNVNAEGREPWRMWEAGDVGAAANSWNPPAYSSGHKLNFYFGGNAYYITEMYASAAGRTYKPTYVIFTYDDGSTEAIDLDYWPNPYAQAKDGLFTVYSRTSSKPVIDVTLQYNNGINPQYLSRWKFKFSLTGGTDLFFGVPGAPLFSLEESVKQPNQVTCLLVRPGTNSDESSSYYSATVFTPEVGEDGVLSWTNNGNLENPESVNIKGPKGDQGTRGTYVDYSSTPTSIPFEEHIEPGQENIKAFKAIADVSGLCHIHFQNAESTTNGYWTVHVGKFGSIVYGDAISRKGMYRTSIPVTKGDTIYITCTPTEPDLSVSNIKVYPYKEDTYDSEEKIIGSWFGKSLYRRVIENLVFPTLNTNGVEIFDLGLIGITVTKLECVSKLTDGRSLVLPYQSQTESCYIYEQGGKILAHSNAEVFNGATNQLVVEYTKPTE